MDFVDLVWHLAGFLAPAVSMAVGMVLLSRILWRNVAPAQSLLAQLAIQLIAGLVVLLAGLVATGHDGRMWTYAALALVAGSVQWALLRRGARR